MKQSPHHWSLSWHSQQLKKTYQNISLHNKRTIQSCEVHNSQHKLRIFAPITWLIIRLAPWAGKMNQILRCDWLPERARWNYLARSGQPVVFRKKTFPESHITNPLLTKLVRVRLLDIGLVFFASVWTSTRKKRTWPISSHLDLTLTSNFCFCVLFVIWHLQIIIFIICNSRVGTEVTTSYLR